MRRVALAGGVILALTAGLGLTVPGTAAATDVKPAKPKATKTSKPPVVTTLPVRDGLEAGGEDRITRRRSTEGKSDPTKTAANATKRAGDAPPPRDRPRATVEDDLQLNIGICGRMQPDGTVPGPTRCQPIINEERPTVVAAKRIPRPQDVTWEQVRSETKNIIFPGLSVTVQPNPRTLVNLDTIVYTDDSKVSTTTVTILGFPVVVEATPMSYTWNFGDGSPALTTRTPGRPYPSKDITHKYMQRGNANLTVTTNYAARFNVADTGWQYVEGTIPVTGPATALQVREAVPVLVDPGR